MRELRDLVYRWLDRIPAREEPWEPDQQAVQADRRLRELQRELAELDVYVDTMSPPRGDDDRSDRRAV